MRISKKGTYAVEVMMVLAHNSEKNMTVSEISRIRQCPLKFLEHVFRDLRKADLITSIRGKNGGYRLKRDAATISCKDIVAAVDGELAPIPCNTKPCAQKDICLIQPLWYNLQAELYHLLDEVILQDLVNTYEEELLREVNYQI